LNESLSEASLVRLLCAESGHWWSDGVWRAKRRADGSACYERTQDCQRKGCTRKRKKQITPRTFQKIGQFQYSGEQQKLGRVHRDELNREQFRRQNH
jgi:hypothetical protein